MPAGTTIRSIEEPTIMNHLIALAPVVASVLNLATTLIGLFASQRRKR
jgi:hypothetical protein